MSVQEQEVQNASQFHSPELETLWLQILPKHLSWFAQVVSGSFSDAASQSCAGQVEEMTNCFKQLSSGAIVLDSR